MAVRSTMAALITRTRLLINDPVSNPSPQFADQDIQDVLDATRLDVKNGSLEPRPTYANGTIEYLDYYASLGDWEDGAVLKQYLTTIVTPSLSEPIPGHWQFATTTLPPVFINGATYDLYRAAADLLERLAARWVLSYNVSVDGQNLQRSQAAVALQNLAHTYRLKQRPSRINATITDLANKMEANNYGLGPTELDYMSSGGGQ